MEDKIPVYMSVTKEDVNLVKLEGENFEIFRTFSLDTVRQAIEESRIVDKRMMMVIETLEVKLLIEDEKLIDFYVNFEDDETL